MKKITGLLLSFLVTCSLLCGCGVKQETTEENKSTNKMAMVIDTTISDGGWGSSCYQAMTDAAKACGWETAYTDNVTSAEYVDSITAYAEEGYQLIFTPGYQYCDAVEQVANEYPDTNFCVFNGTLETDNIVSVMPDAKEIGYMAGALAGLMTKTDSVGFIGGMELDTTKAKLANFEAAAKQVNDQAKVYSAFANSFSDGAKGKDMASSMISTYDVDIMFGDASAIDSGVREALAESKNRYDIGQPADLGSKEDPIIICSIVTNNEALLEQCMNEIEEGTFGNKTIYGNMQNGCLKVGTFSNQVPEEVQEQYAKILDEIKAGTFIK